MPIKDAFVEKAAYEADTFGLGTVRRGQLGAELVHLHRSANRVEAEARLGVPLR